MNSGNNGQNTAGKIFIGAVMALAVVVLILLATGRLDGFFSADDLIYDDNSLQSVSDNAGDVNNVDSEGNHGSVPENGQGISDSVPEAVELHFRSTDLLEQHYQKHGIDMGFGSAEEYEKAAAAVVSNPNSLHKIEAEDGDDVYYIESTNEFVIVSTDGYLRTYFYPDRGKDYFDRQ